MINKEAIDKIMTNAQKFTVGANAEETLAFYTKNSDNHKKGELVADESLKRVAILSKLLYTACCYTRNPETGKESFEENTAKIQQKLQKLQPFLNDMEDALSYFHKKSHFVGQLRINTFAINRLLRKHSEVLSDELYCATARILSTARIFKALAEHACNTKFDKVEVFDMNNKVADSFSKAYM